MLTLGIRYLQGVAVGSHSQHGRVEWPPHPARIFMAMVAAHYQTGADPAEREALIWLEKQMPPEILASEALSCCVVTQFVPVNDKAGSSNSPVHSLSITRHRIDRTFARASLARDIVMLRWPDAEPLDVKDALVTLCSKVTRIGHSSSLVQMWVGDVEADGLQQWRRHETRPTHLLRVPCEGTLEELDRSFNGEAVANYIELLLAVETAETSAEKSNRKKALKAQFPDGEPRQDRPRVSTYAGYTLADGDSNEAIARGGDFSPHLAVFVLERTDGPYRSLDLACTLALTDRWRQAIASHANDLSPEAQSLLTGHAPGESPMRSAHVAFLPLGFVGHQHATGHLLGVALAVPNEALMPLDVRRDVLRVAGRVHGLKLGRLGVWKLDSSTMARPLETLRPASWTAAPNGAKHWSTVTPISFDHHSKAKGKADCTAETATMIRVSCERIGLPSPREVVVTPVSAHLGAPPAHAFPRLRRKDGSERRHTHAILIFDEPVCGPVLLGAGRYRGYGMCRPMEDAR